MVANSRSQYIKQKHVATTHCLEILDRYRIIKLAGQQDLNRQTLLSIIVVGLSVPRILIGESRVNKENDSRCARSTLVFRDFTLKGVKCISCNFQSPFDLLRHQMNDILGDEGILKEVVQPGEGLPVPHNASVLSMAVF